MNHVRVLRLFTSECRSLEVPCGGQAKVAAFRGTEGFALPGQGLGSESKVELHAVEALQENFRDWSPEEIQFEATTDLSTLISRSHKLLETRG